MAKPNSNNSITGITRVMTIVRLSRTICTASFFMSDMNMPIASVISCGGGRHGSEYTVHRIRRIFLFQSPGRAKRGNAAVNHY